MQLVDNLPALVLTGPAKCSAKFAFFWGWRDKRFYLKNYRIPCIQIKIHIYLYADILGNHDQCFLLAYVFFWKSAWCQQLHNDRVLVFLSFLFPWWCVSAPEWKFYFGRMWGQKLFKNHMNSRADAGMFLKLPQLALLPWSQQKRRAHGVAQDSLLDQWQSQNRLSTVSSQPKAVTPRFPCLLKETFANYIRALGRLQELDKKDLLTLS